MTEKLQNVAELGLQHKYKEQGEAFLDATSSTLEVVEAVPQKPVPWAKDLGTSHRIADPIHYACTLKNARGSYTFDFWGSIADAEMVKRAETAAYDSYEMKAVYAYLKENGHGVGLKRVQRARLIEAVHEAVKPDAYTILTCLHDSAGESFADFCGNYGYDEDSRAAERTYHAVLEQERNMRRLYTHEEIEVLETIS